MGHPCLRSQVWIRPPLCRNDDTKAHRIAQRARRQTRRCGHTGHTTYDNEDNLAPGFYAHIRATYEGTRTGRQEIHADLLDQSEDALWDRQWIDDGRVEHAPDSLVEVVVAIDPAVSPNPHSSDTGIAVAGVDSDKRCYVLADGSGRMSPSKWAERAIALYDKHSADRIIGETNNGGDLVREVLRTASGGKIFRFIAVNASRGKYARAEPISALYEQGKVHHVGTFPDLEDQMCTWTPKSSYEISPDRMDALVWAISHLVTRIWV